MSHAVRRGHLKMSLNCFNLNTRVLNNVTMILTEKGREKKTLVWGLKWKLFPTKRQRRESANSQGRFSAWAGVHGKTLRLRVRCPRPSRDRVPVRTDPCQFTFIITPLILCLHDGNERKAKVLSSCTYPLRHLMKYKVSPRLLTPLPLPPIAGSISRGPSPRDQTFGDRHLA